MKKYKYKYFISIVESEGYKLKSKKEIYFKTYKKAYHYLKTTADKYNANIQDIEDTKFKNYILDMKISNFLIYGDNNYVISMFLFKERFDYKIYKKINNK